MGLICYTDDGEKILVTEQEYEQLVDETLDILVDHRESDTADTEVSKSYLVDETGVESKKVMDAILRRLMRDNYIVSTPDWNYKAASHA